MDESSLDVMAAAWVDAMRRGDFESAYRQTDLIERERRALQARGAFRPQPHYLTWNGDPFEDRDVVVRCSHGLGDTLQFVRYVLMLGEVARSVTLLVQPQLLSLFADAAEFGDVHNAWAFQTRPDALEIEVMELPYAFRSTTENLPRAVPYLPRQPIDAAAARLPRFDTDDAFKVGLLWAASDWDTSRSIPLNLLEPLRHVQGVTFYSLQQGTDADMWREAPLAIQALHHHTHEITAAAAAMLELDLVITVDAMAAHLAGALARPVWVLLKHRADWRWMSDRSDSPWYPTMRLYRQRRAGDWQGVVNAVATDLERAAQSAGLR